MLRRSKSIVTGFMILTVALLINFVGADLANACGWGRSGGGDYVPQRRDSQGLMANKPALTKEQAQDIVSNYVKRLNPDLEIGKVTDNGGFYEVEIIADDDQIIQLVGVDKQSGRLILLN